MALKNEDDPREPQQASVPADGAPPDILLNQETPRAQAVYVSVSGSPSDRRTIAASRGSDASL